MNFELMQLLQKALERHGLYREAERLLRCSEVLF